MKPKQLVTLFILVILTACSCAMALKAAIGVGAYDVLSQTISNMTGIKVGTIGIVLNSSCVLIEYLILKKNFTVKHVLQIPVALILGVVVNVILYDVMTFTINHYILRVILLLCAYLLMGMCNGFILSLDIVTFPLEGCCLCISNKFNIGFGKIRQLVDVICIIVSLFITITFKMDLVVREGTVIGMFILAPLMNYFMNIGKKLIKKNELIERD